MGYIFSSLLGLTWKIGVTPMIGVNDVSSEVFTLADAQALVNYAQTDANIARLAMWSVARDNGNSAGAHYASPDSSGIAQQPYAFAAIYSARRRRPAGWRRAIPAIHLPRATVPPRSWLI